MNTSSLHWIKDLLQVEFPFLVLLISGGHSLIAVAQSATDFQLLGQSRDDAPGEAFDKVKDNVFEKKLIVYLFVYKTWNGPLYLI